jgi:hypothetical protein
MEVGKSKIETGKSKFENGNSKVENGNWTLENGTLALSPGRGWTATAFSPAVVGRVRGQLHGEDAFGLN